jgi:hypothetical protein
MIGKIELEVPSEERHADGCRTRDAGGRRSSARVGSRAERRRVEAAEHRGVGRNVPRIGTHVERELHRNG